MQPHTRPTPEQHTHGGRHWTQGMWSAAELACAKALCTDYIRTPPTVLRIHNYLVSQRRSSGHLVPQHILHRYLRPLHTDLHYLQYHMSAFNAPVHNTVRSKTTA